MNQKKERKWLTPSLDNISKYLLLYFIEIQQQIIKLCPMSIPIIISRRKANGEQERINMNLSPTLQFDKTFNPQALKQLSQINSKADTLEIQNNTYTIEGLTQNYQNKCNSGWKPMSRDKIRRRISSSGVSKRFPKDFFKLQNDEDLQNVNPSTKGICSRQGQNRNLLSTLQRANSSKPPDRQNALIQKLFKQKKNGINVRIRHKTLQPKQTKQQKENQVPDTPKFSCKGNKTLIRQRLSSKHEYQNQPVTLQNCSKAFRSDKQRTSKNYGKKQTMFNNKNFAPIEPSIIAFNQLSENLMQSPVKKQNKLANKSDLLQCQTIKPFAIKKSSAKSFMSKMGKNQKSDLVLVKKFTLPQRNENKQNTGQAFDKIDLSTDKKRKKVVCVGGKKLNIQPNQTGGFKVKLFN